MGGTLTLPDQLVQQAAAQLRVGAGLGAADSEAQELEHVLDDLVARRLLCSQDCHIGYVPAYSSESSPWSQKAKWVPFIVGP